MTSGSRRKSHRLHRPGRLRRRGRPGAQRRLGHRQLAPGGLLVLGLIVFPLIITGVVLNTIFLVREIRRNEQHDAFINAVTHELKTPVASIRLYLQTLQSRDIDDAKRQEFYRVMLDDTDRLLGTIEQVLRAGSAGAKLRHASRTPIDLCAMVRDCLALARTRHHLPTRR